MIFRPTASLIVLLLILSACKDDCRLKNPELLYGRWKVFMVDRGGEKMGGRAFHGTEYTFLDGGTVRAETPAGDTSSAQYSRSCDTLTYLYPQGQETYRIDSLSQDRMFLSGELQGIPTSVYMMRVRQPGEAPEGR